MVEAQISGGPDWMNSAKFDIEATAPGANPAEIRPMVQRLLADRFGLVVRRETRTLPIYRLMRARDDGKLPKGLTPEPCPKATDNTEHPPCGGLWGGVTFFQGYALTMDGFAKLLSQNDMAEIDRIVVDATGLTGEYRFSMQFSPTREHFGLRSEPDPNQPSFTTALQEQVGLKLQPASGPVEVLVIQSARWPASN